MIEKAKNVVSNIYHDTHSKGKVLALIVFATHGILDYLTTITAYYIINLRGGDFSDVEANVLISGSDPVEMFFIIVGGSAVISIIMIITYYFNRTLSESGLERWKIDLSFGVIAIMGIALVANNFVQLLLI